MERDIEKAIQAKLNKAEQSPTAWDRNKVWLAIERDVVGKPQHFIFYYAAASVLLAAVMLIFLLQPKHDIIKPVVLNRERNATEPLHTEKESGVSIKHAGYQTRTAQDHRKHDQMKRILTVDSPPYSGTDSSAALTEIKIMAEDSIDIEQTIQNVSALSVEPVHAIFGIDDEIALVSSPRKSKKVRLRLFKHEDEKSPIVHTNEPANLFAKINKDQTP